MNSRWKFRCCSLALGLALFGPGSAAAVSSTLDVNQPDISTAAMVSMTFVPITQSFVPGAADLVGAGVYRRGITDGDLTLSIYDAPLNQGGSELASSTLLGTSGDGWADAFWAPVSVTPGQSYYLVITGDNYTDIPGNFILAGSQLDPYPDGELILQGIDPSVSSGWELAFRTYSSVPEPTAAAMLAAGAVLLAVPGRRRARRSRG